MKSGIIIKHNKINLLLILPKIDNTNLFQIVPIINEEISSNRELKESLVIIKKQLSNLNIENTEYVEILAEIN